MRAEAPPFPIDHILLLIDYGRQSVQEILSLRVGRLKLGKKSVSLLVSRKATRNVKRQVGIKKKVGISRLLAAVDPISTRRHGTCDWLEFVSDDQDSIEIKEWIG